jgi:ATP-dependent Lon protease
MPRFEKSSKKRRNKKYSDSESSSDEESIGSSDSYSEESEYEETEYETEEDDEETEYETEDEEEEEDSEYETEEDSDASSPPPMTTRSRSKKNKKKRSEEDEDDDEDELDEREIQKIVSKLFPSRYSKQRNRKLKKKDKLLKKKKQKKRQKKKDSDSEESSSNDSDQDYEEYMQQQEDENQINIVFGFGGSNIDESEELAEDDENEECDSEDEKTFAKETYQIMDLPEETKKTEESEKEKKEKNKKKKKSKKNKSKDSEESDHSTSNTFESEYNDLVDMKKYIMNKLHTKPKSKTLLKSLNECKDSIKKLVKKTRDRNTKNYHKLITSHKQKITNEMDYFKKKLSNKEQIKIMNDLKEINEQIQVNIPYRVKLLDSHVPNKYKAAVMQKLNVLKSMEPTDNEYYKIKNWVDAFMRIPFGSYKELDIDMNSGIEQCTEFMNSAINALDTCVFGLNDAKMQILQMIGQWLSNPSALGTAIAVKGPPGTGKTSLIKEGISKILGRDFAFIALGGASDSSFLEGHSYTYEGSLWGKIVQILMESKSMNPVIYFDELDKVSDTPKGEEIIGILTHLTDTSQNSAFHDKFFADIDFDLSKCLFIFSYNDESKVNPILKDRMYRIETKGYSTKDKVTIAKNYLLPKIREQVNFTEEDIIVPDETIEYIASNKGLTQGEEGVRNLKRCLEIIHTKLNLFRLVKSENNMISKEIKLEVTFPFTVTKQNVDTLIKSEEGLSQSMLQLYI